MLTTIIILSLLFLVLSVSSISTLQRSIRLRKLKKIATELRHKYRLAYDAGERTQLNITEYYKNPTHKKLKKIYKWELHESF